MNSVYPCVDGNSGKRAPNAYLFEEYERVKTCILTYADDYGIPQPAVPGGRDEDTPIYLPASHTKNMLMMFRRKHRGYLYIFDNPLLCDCNMKWFLYYRRIQNLTMNYKKNFPICSGPANMKGKRLDKLQLSDIRCDCRIPGKLYKEENITDTCNQWETASTDETGDGKIVKAEENYCTNLYTDEPVCFSRKKSDLVPYDVPICSDNLCDVFLKTCYEFLPLYSRLQYIYRDLMSLVPSSRLHCGLARILVKQIQYLSIHCPDHRNMTRALPLRSYDSKQMFEKCYLLENNQHEFPTKGMLQVNPCLEYLKDVFLSETKEKFCRSVSMFANCKLSTMMNVTNGTITEDDENFVVSRLQRELQHTGIEQYNCSNTSHTTQSEHSTEKASPYSEDNQSLPITYLIDCKIPGVSYLGTQNMTERGFACQAWNKQYPHKHNYGSYPGAQENFCRDFESDEPWCFTTNRKVVWERCIVPSCGVNATANSSSCVSVEELNISELKDERSCRSYCNWIRTTINDAIGKAHLQNGRTCGIHEKSNIIRRKEHLLRRGTFTPWMCSISIFDNKEDECTISERQYSDLQWIRAALIVVGIYLMLVIVIVLTVKIHRMTKKLDVEIVQLEARAQRELLEIACMLMHRELRRAFRRRFRQRSTRYQSIAEDHYELIPIVDDPYEAPLRRPASLSGTGYQDVAPYEIRKEGCFCRYCLDQAAKDPQNSFPKVEGAHGAVSGYESLQGITKEEPLLDEATSKKQTHYSLLNISPGISWRDDEGKASTLNDPSQSTRRRHSRRRMRRRRISDIDDHDDDGIGSGWIPLQQIKQTNEDDDDDAKFISQLLSDVKREPITDVFPGFGPFKIPITLPKFKREEEKEPIPLSEFSFLEAEIQKEQHDVIRTKNTEPDQPNFETEIFKHDETYNPIKEASNDLVHISDTKRKADDRLMTAITGVCIAEVHFDIENSGDQSDSSDYLQPISEKDSKGGNPSETGSGVIHEFCIAEMNFDVDNIEDDLKSEENIRETDSEEANAAAGFCIAEVNFDVQNIEALSASSEYRQLITDTESKQAKMSMALSTGPCIAELHFDIENTEPVSDSSDYLEPTELGSRTHIRQGEESENKTYEQLQNVSDTNVSIPNLEGLNEHPMQDDANVKICFADLNNFQEILSEIESVEISASWIRDSSANEYEKLGQSSEIDINVPEEVQRTETPTPFTDFGPDVCFAELQNFEQLLIESEAVEQAPSDDSHGSHYDEIKINVDINHGDGSDRISK